MRDHTGPPYPSPRAEEVRAMPDDTEKRRADKRAAALAWLTQFCARARWYLDVTDLRLAYRTKPACAAEIDKIRSLLDAETLEKILSTREGG